MERLIQRLPASISRATRETEENPDESKEGEKREKEALSLSLPFSVSVHAWAYVDYGFTWASEGKRRGREERRRVKETVSRTLLPASLCGAHAEREKGRGERREAATASLTRHEKHSLQRVGVVVWQEEEKKSRGGERDTRSPSFSAKQRGRNNGDAGIMPPR